MFLLVCGAYMVQHEQSSGPVTLPCFPERCSLSATPKQIPVGVLLLADEVICDGAITAPHWA